MMSEQKNRAIILHFGMVKADFYIDELKEQGRSLSNVSVEITGYDENRYKVLFVEV